MKEIKSLANKLRDQLRTGEADPKNLPKIKRDPPGPDKSQKQLPLPSQVNAATFFNGILNFQVELTEKSLIRVDKRTLNLLKRIKLTHGVDMNRFIVYALHQYLSQHPWLSDYINQTLKNTEP
ncbi:hypothetical protein OHD16_15685 [Sphingobacterium sp. ML3W]|uniref:hypothetical protein n=1 Tax=Sphingobacterium sp. ML3W TaxID=1538644 RepID=UPI00249B56B2|nr:hypothetical protein [Sphingobacterium sp. ML3W]WFA81396.1 hypothetical protein OGI71_08825 [Sphingobacterium sp. ML3W]